MAKTSDSTEGLETRLCGPEDRAAQGRLYELCFEQEQGETTLCWRYDANPHGRAVSLLTVTGAGEAISGYACSPRRVLALGEERTAATVGQTGDVMTHPKWRGKGVFSALDRAAMAETERRGWPVVFGLPNRKSEPIFTGKLGWLAVGRIRPWTFVLTPDAGARRERMRAGRLASAMVPWTYWRGMMRRGKLQARAAGKASTVPIAKFSAEVDDISREVERRFPWMVRRDHAYLNWRFIDAPSGLFRAHGVYEPSGALRGYAVVQLPRSGEAVGFLVDVLALDDVALAAAVDSALGHLLKAGASVARAHAMVGSWWERQLRNAGFRAHKPADFKVVIAYVHDPASPLAAAAKDPSTWYFTDGDRDDETVA